MIDVQARLYVTAEDDASADRLLLLIGDLVRTGISGADGQMVETSREVAR